MPLQLAFVLQMKRRGSAECELRTYV
ncbi:MAG: hypothetical protein RLZZ157_404, partial [Pseudomonadota bacterium]